MSFTFLLLLLSFLSINQAKHKHKHKHSHKNDVDVDDDETVETAKSISPNIIFVFADDWGMNEWEISGCSHTRTPFLHNLVKHQSLILKYNYVNTLCSASRSAFLSGRHPSKLGVQSLMFNSFYPVSLTRQVSVLSEEFKQAGYSTHIVGKWHLGFQAWEYTPTYRGFDTFDGFYNGFSDYDTKKCDQYYDLRHNEDIVTDEDEMAQFSVWWERDYALSVLADHKDSESPFFLYLAFQASHEPNDAPDDYTDIYSALTFKDQAYTASSNEDNTDNTDDAGGNDGGPFDPDTDTDDNEDTDDTDDSESDPDDDDVDDDDDESDSTEDSTDDSYSEQVTTSRISSMAQSTTLDESLQAIVKYLKRNDMWDNTLIVFSSDNGGTRNRGDNYPLRGYKFSAWEGGIRVPGFVTGGYLNDERKGQTLENVIVHVTDWYPTLLSAANIDISYARSTKLHFEDEDDDTDRTDNRFGNLPPGTVPLDGLDLWRYIQNDIHDDDVDPSVSTNSREVLNSLVSKACNWDSCGAIRKGKYKFLRGSNDVIGWSMEGAQGSTWGTNFALDKCTKQSENSFIGCDNDDSLRVGDDCQSDYEGCLFDIEADPCEYNNLVDTYPHIAKYLRFKLNEYQELAVSELIDVDVTVSSSFDDQFWGPYQGYDDVVFEQLLNDDFGMQFFVDGDVFGEDDHAYTDGYQFSGRNNEDSSDSTDSDDSDTVHDSDSDSDSEDDDDDDSDGSDNDDETEVDEGESEELLNVNEIPNESDKDTHRSKIFPIWVLPVALVAFFSILFIVMRQLYGIRKKTAEIVSLDENTPLLIEN